MVDQAGLELRDIHWLLPLGTGIMGHRTWLKCVVGFVFVFLFFITNLSLCVVKIHPNLSMYQYIIWGEGFATRSYIAQVSHKYGMQLTIALNS